MANTDFNIGVINSMDCLKEGWEIIKPNYWLLFAISLVGVLIGGMSMYIALGAMICGIYLCFLKAIDGKPVAFETLFDGFKYFLPSLLVTIVIVVPMFAMFLVIYFPLILAAVMGSKLSESELIALFLGSFAIDIVIALVMICFHTLLMFAFPLIVDRNLSGWQAMKLSSKAVWKNLGGVVGLWLVMFLISLVGAITCIGTYFAIPIMLATLLVAYRKVFPSLERQNFDIPPMPSNYNL